MSKQIKKIGSNIDLKGLVIHKVNKTAGISNATVKNATKELNVTDKERIFIGKIFRSYFDNSKPLYGVFSNENPKFKNNLEVYVEGGDFFSFSVDAAETYKNVIKNSAPATGGFLIFSHFKNIDKDYDYMLIMTITNKDGFVVNEDDLSIKDIKNLDLSKIDVACMINITKWKSIHNGDDNESKTYLSFARGNKDVSVYFMSFIDCDNKTTKTESTNRLIKALEDYCVFKGYERDVKVRKRNEVYNYCSACIESRKEIQLSAISALLDIENQNDFEVFAADEKYGVSSIINGDKQKLKPMKFVTYKDKSMTVEFDAGLLKEGKVIFDVKKKQLTFKDLPESLINQIP